MYVTKTLFVGVVPLVSNKDLKATDNMRQGNRTIVLPILYGFYIVNVDDKVLLLALVVNFGLGSVSASHRSGQVGGSGFELGSFRQDRAVVVARYEVLD